MIGRIRIQLNTYEAAKFNILLGEREPISYVEVELGEVDIDKGVKKNLPDEVIARVTKLPMNRVKEIYS